MRSRTFPRLIWGMAGVVVLLLALFAFTTAQAPAAQAQNKPGGSAHAAAANSETIHGSPISVVVRPSGAYAVFRNGVAQFFGEYAEGAYLWINGVVYGPEQVPAGPAVNNYTPVSQSISGSGSADSPWVVTTVVAVGNTGYQLTQKVSYVNGQEFIRNDWSLCLVTGQNAAVQGVAQAHLFHAADLYTEGNDRGYGYYDAATGSVGGYNQNRDLYQIFVPITGATHYQEDTYSTIWGAIGNSSGPGSGFQDSYRPDDFIDNGAGLEWVFNLGSCNSFSDYTSSSGSPVIPTPGTPGVPSATPQPTATPEGRREKPANVWYSLHQDPDNTLAPGAVFTYTVRLNNDGPGTAHDAAARIEYDPSIQVLDFHSSESQVFVTEVTTHSISIAFHELAKQEVQWAWVIAKVRPEAVVGTVQEARAYISWEDTGSPKRWTNAVVSTVGATTADSGHHGLLRSLLVAPSDPVTAGATVAMGAAFYGSKEPVSFWLNLPDGTVAAIDTIGHADDQGTIALTLSTTGLPPGTYSLVAHGIKTGMEATGVFTVR